MLGAQTQVRDESIESMIEIVRRTRRNVKRWQSGDMCLRWTAAGMLEAEQQFRKITATAASPSSPSPSSATTHRPARPDRHHNPRGGRYAGHRLTITPGPPSRSSATDGQPRPSVDQSHLAMRVVKVSDQRRRLRQTGQREPRLGPGGRPANDRRTTTPPGTLGRAMDDFAVRAGGLRSVREGVGVDAELFEADVGATEISQRDFTVRLGSETGWPELCRRSAHAGPWRVSELVCALAAAA